MISSIFLVRDSKREKSPLRCSARVTSVKTTRESPSLLRLMSALYAVRTLIEIDAIRTVTDNRLPLSGAEQAVARLGALPADAKWSDVVAADLEFHRAIVVATGRSSLLRLFSLLEDEIRLAMAQLRPAYKSNTSLYEGHRELLAVIQSGDSDKAAHLLQVYLEAASNNFPRKFTVGL